MRVTGDKVEWNVRSNLVILRRCSAHCYEDCQAKQRDYSNSLHNNISFHMPFFWGFAGLLAVEPKVFAVVPARPVRSRGHN
jgi:hypothetical protein